MPVSGNSPQSPRSPASTTPATTPASPFAAQLQQIPLPKSPAGPSQRLLALCSECSALLQQPAGDAAAPLAALGSLARREPALLWQHERALRPLCALLLQCGRHDALVAEVVTQALSHGGEAYADVAVAAAAWLVAGPADERRLQGVKTILYHAHRAVAVPLLRRLLAAAGTERQLHARGGEALGVCALECAEVAFASWSEGALASVEEALADALLRVSSSPSARVQAAWALALQAAHRRGKAEHGRADEWSAVAHSLADACGEHHPSTAALRATLGETTLGEAVGAAPPPPLAAGPSFHIAAPVAGPISRGWAWLLSLAPWRPPRLGLALVALGLALAALASSARVDVGGGPASVVGGAFFAPCRSRRPRRSWSARRRRRPGGGGGEGGGGGARRRGGGRGGGGGGGDVRAAVVDVGPPQPRAALPAAAAGAALRGAVPGRRGGGGGRRRGGGGGRDRVTLFQTCVYIITSLTTLCASQHFSTQASS